VKKQKKIYNQFIQINPNYEGVWRSGTDGNYGCLLLIQNEELLNNIINTEKEKHSYYGLELLFNTHFILPPSPSKCKKTNVLRNRHLINPDKPVYIINHNDKVWEFIMNFLPKINNQPTEKPTKKK
jgi:hypothetical protein